MNKSKWTVVGFIIFVLLFLGLASVKTHFQLEEEDQLIRMVIVKGGGADTKYKQALAEDKVQFITQKEFNDDLDKYKTILENPAIQAVDCLEYRKLTKKGRFSPERRAELLDSWKYYACYPDQ